MPELPEAETIVRGLRAQILNRRILSIHFPKARYFRPQLEQPLEHYIEAHIRDIFRHGKSVIVQLETPSRSTVFIVVRLGMTGQLLLGTSTDRHTHARFELDPPGPALCFRDHRQFGRMLFVSDWRTIFQPRPGGPSSPSRNVEIKDHSVTGSTLPSSIPPVADPLKIDGEDFVKIFSGRRGMIKAALMGQQLLVGVGNIYADESLFAAKIHPKQKIHRLSRAQLRKFFFTLVRILNRAIERGGSSISDFVDANNSQGEFQLAHRVYGRTGEKCLRKGCPGIIKRIRMASRSTHYCPKCQRQV